MAKERLQKILSACGYGSRRDCEKIIAAGDIQLNGEIAKLGDKGDLEIDDIRFRGERIPPASQKHVYIVLNKPINVISDIKKKGKRTTVIDLVNHQGYLFIVGRLDYRSEGLILLTDDGELANRLTHPRYEHEKEYEVLVKGYPSSDQLARWRKGVKIENAYQTMPCKVSYLKRENHDTWLRVVLKEGKKRQIREVGQALSLPVLRIVRNRISTLLLGDLAVGEWRYLERFEIKQLKNSCSLN